MIPSRNDSTIGTVIGVFVFAIAIIGTMFFDWSWENPEGYVLPLAIGFGAAIFAVIIAFRNR